MFETIDAMSLPETGAILCSLFAVFLAMAWAFFPNEQPRTPEQRRTNRAERANELIAAGKWHRERLEAAADELAELHGYDPRSDEGEELTAVVLFGVDYDYSLTRIEQITEVKHGNGH